MCVSKLVIRGYPAGCRPVLRHFEGFPKGGFLLFCWEGAGYCKSINLVCFRCFEPEEREGKPRTHQLRHTSALCVSIGGLLCVSICPFEHLGASPRRRVGAILIPDDYRSDSHDSDHPCVANPCTRSSISPIETHKGLMCLNWRLVFASLRVWSHAPSSGWCQINFI